MFIDMAVSDSDDAQIVRGKRHPDLTKTQRSVKIG